MKKSDLEELDLEFKNLETVLKNKKNSDEELISIKNLLIFQDKLYISIKEEFNNSKRTYKILAESRYNETEVVTPEEIKEIEVSIEHVKEFIHKKKNTEEEVLAIKNLLVELNKLFNKTYRENVLINKIIREMDI